MDAWRNSKKISLLAVAILYLFTFFNLILDAPLISANFSKKFEMTIKLFSEAWGKLIHKKTWSRKSQGTVSLTGTISRCTIGEKAELPGRACPSWSRTDPAAFTLPRCCLYFVDDFFSSEQQSLPYWQYCGSGPYVGPPGSGSVSQRYGSGPGSFHHQAKVVGKTFIPTLHDFFRATFYLWKMM
jgi:hypothetical protein